MAVQPAPVPVISLAPDRNPSEVSNLMRALDTERSAGKALLSALRDLEANLVAERRRVTDLEVEREKAQEEMSTGKGELDRQRKITTGLFAQLEEARAALEDERTKPLFKRLFNR